MRYGRFELADAHGIMLAHSLRLETGRLPKGHVLGGADIERIASEGIRSVIGVQLDDGDLAEDSAAAQIAAAIPRDQMRFSEAATGRVNVYATVDGLFIANKSVVDRLNAVDPAITLACLADHTRVKAGDMLATIKIIPLAVNLAKVDKAVAGLSAEPPFYLAAFSARSVTLVATELPTLKPSVMDKTAALLSRRLATYGSRITKEIRLAHDQNALAEVLRAIPADGDGEPATVIIFGASAVADPDDVIPAAIRAAGGVVEHIGMPVDPGNLLILARLGNTPVIGAPGCARSPKENGFDWVLDRIMAGKTPTRSDITGMGVGGLLMEIATRPLPREGGQSTKPVNVSAVLLAAGQARRMGGPHKLLAEFDGIPLVRRTALTLLAADLASVAVVTGHRQDDVRKALKGLPLRLVANPDYATGMASSLICGFSDAETAASDGVLVMLADMPAVSNADIDLLVAAYRESGGSAVIRSVHLGKRGNPIILPRAAYAAVLRLEGDVGARAIIENSGLDVVDIDIGPAAHIDVDTPEAVVAAGGVLVETRGTECG